MQLSKELSKLPPNAQTCALSQAGDTAYLFIARTTLIDCYKVNKDSIFQQHPVQLPLDEQFTFDYLASDELGMVYAAVFSKKTNLTSIYEFNNQVAPHLVLTLAQQGTRMRKMLVNAKKIYFITDAQSFEVFKLGQARPVQLKRVAEGSGLFQLEHSTVLVDGTQIIFLTSKTIANCMMQHRVVQLIEIDDKIYCLLENNTVYRINAATKPTLIIQAPNLVIKNIFNFDGQLALFNGEKFFTFSEQERKVVARCATRHQVLTCFVVAQVRLLIISTQSDLQLMAVAENRALKNIANSTQQILSPQVVQDMYLNFDQNLNLIKMTQVKTGFSKRFDPISGARIGVSDGYLYQYTDSVLQIYDVAQVYKQFNIRLATAPELLQVKKLHGQPRLLVVYSNQYSLFRAYVDLDQKEGADASNLNQQIALDWRQITADSTVTIIALGEQNFVKTFDSLFRLDLQTDQLEPICKFPLRPMCMCVCGRLLAMAVDDQVVLFSGARIIDRFRPNGHVRIVKMCAVGPSQVALLNEENAVQVVELFHQNVAAALTLYNFGAVRDVARTQAGLSVLGDNGLMFVTLEAVQE